MQWGVWFDNIDVSRNKRFVYVGASTLVGGSLVVADDW
jgi:hypothetical protein